MNGGGIVVKDVELTRVVPAISLKKIPFVRESNDSSRENSSQR